MRHRVADSVPAESLLVSLAIAHTSSRRLTESRRAQSLAQRQSAQLGVALAPPRRYPAPVCSEEPSPVPFFLCVSKTGITLNPAAASEQAARWGGASGSVA